MGRLFGTDGARGIANSELTVELAVNIGRAAAYVLTEKTTEKPVVPVLVWLLSKQLCKPIMVKYL